MQAIVTKYLGPTNTKGGRIKALADAGSITISYPQRLNPPEAHAEAARQLAEKLEWTAPELGELVQGWLPDNVPWAYAFCFAGAK